MSIARSLGSFSTFAGCGAKLGPDLLDKALCGLSQRQYPDLIADYRGSEDAGVLRLSADLALVHTVDFFPPIVEDPVLFGRIAAANSLSDVYAMGGRPSTAVCVVTLPADSLDIAVLRQMMEGGLSALEEADCPLVGGHTVNGRELTFGYAVTGLVHPDRLWRNNTIRGGEQLLLTKPIGTGLVVNAARAGLASRESYEAAVVGMRTLNRGAGEALARWPVRACTDVTGFGLLGHACEMASGSLCDIRLAASDVPLLPGAREYAAMGLVPAGTWRTRGFRLHLVDNPAGYDKVMLDVLFDPQTSGGLLAAVPEADARGALEALRAAGVPAAIVGETVAGSGRIVLA